MSDSSAATALKVASAVAAGAPNTSGVSIAASCCRTGSYSAIDVARFIEESPMKSMANGSGPITVTLIPNAATSCANVSAKPATANLD
jgi:hypothetical protein